MRVLHVLPTLGYGGVSRVVLNYRPHLQAVGVTFDFITHGGHEAFHEALADQGSTIHYVQPIHKVGLRGYMRALRALNPRTYDVVHVHTGHLTGVYALMFRALGCRRIVLHAHASRAVNTSHERFMWLLRLMARMISPWRLACGTAAGNYCFGQRKYQILPNGLDFEAIPRLSADEVSAARRELGLLPDFFAIGQVGRLTFEKNHLFMLSVFERYNHADPSSRYLIIGDGPLRGEVQTSLQGRSLVDSVQLLGQRDDVYRLMKSLDVLVLPSVFEGLPMAVVEAQACGLRCLVSDAVDGGVDLGLGLVRFVPAGDADEWLAALRDVRNTPRPTLDDEAIRARLIETGYEVSSSAARLAEYYRMVMEQPR